MPSPSSDPRFADFYAVNRGGGLFSEALSQRLGAAIALVGARLRLTPRALTLLNLVLGLATSALVVTSADAVADGSAAAWPVGLAALTGWQLAYAFDCADGQLARVTGKASPDGARLDILCDVAAQIGLVTALAAVAAAHRPQTPAWLVAAFAGCWMVNLVTSVLASGPNAVSMLTSASLPVRVVKLVRDYGAVIFVAGLTLVVAPALTVWLVVAFTAVNGGFLLASIGHLARPRPAKS
ncbi:CDP-alcohol phosphatidyltransferase family protein [Pilimelia columellifera]|uniref:CDP-alcohol phosphatidyltransferase n=1 Tax=Pilimelia columellifera subsp. columellifera TaxID=706583 RepID=A0ABP6ALA8_9ACTN